jgi:hypothetical protein
MDALAEITMELMQGYVKDNGVRGVDDPVRWPVESMAFKFLEATTTAVSIEQLKQVSQLKLSWNLILLGRSQGPSTHLHRSTPGL